ncbi:hypothetical protein EUGRSUZ_F02521 [Eucalyptus grandis]|uniref:Uncharacterized protein n=2 Tax=Eucalyptus grandis TaxID=71139 RepID=A0ACC3KJW7_EUCGR|nr:hypothetical protein EUGRSUZ_F02521 [Eucalyptus grandis]
MFLVVMINRTQSQGNEDLYLSCSNLCNCRNIQDVGFPFWGGNPSRSCGHPALQLACEDNAASITMYNVKYKVLDFYPSTKVLQIVREDIFTEICPPNFTNTTLDPALFSEINHYEWFQQFLVRHKGRCTQSKGACGYDISKNSTACYCPDGSSGSATCSLPAAGGPQRQPGSKDHVNLLTETGLTETIFLIDESAYSFLPKLTISYGTSTKGTFSTFSTVFGHLPSYGQVETAKT